MPSATPQLFHATTVAWERKAALILGASGSGKSTLALQLMAFGCDLVADDQTEVTSDEGALHARCPTPIQGQIEARGFGILRTEFVETAKLVCAVDLGEPENARLPDPKTLQIDDIALPLFHNCGIDVLPFALLQYLKGPELVQI